MKKIHIVGDATSKDWFDLTLEDEEISLKPWMMIEDYHIARFGLFMDDDGLSGAGIEANDYLLISDYSTEPIFGKPVLVRQDGRFIVRIAADVNPVECTFTTSDDVYPPIVVPSENIRIVGVVSGVIKGAKFEFA